MFSTILLTLAFVGYAILGGIFYMIRGGGIGSDIPSTETQPARGGLLNISRWLKRLGLPAPRDLIIIAVFLMPLVNAPILYYWLGYTGWNLAAMTFALSSGYILSFMSGWGEYFDIGNWTLYYKNHRENFIIDWICYKVFGPEWIPKNARVTPDNPDFDLIASPTGDINPYEWRKNRDTFGMFLRMLFSVTIFGGIALVKHFMLGVAWLHVLPIVSLTLVFAVGVAAIYRYYRNPSLVWEVNPKYRINEDTGRAELATGILLHILVIIAIVVL